MSCDIHVHVEVKIAGRWEHYNHPSGRQNYEMFGRMAGVRGDAEPIAEPRGLPDDASIMTRFDASIWGDDGHSHSWLSVDEMAALSRWVELHHLPHGFEGAFGYLFGSGWEGWVDYPEDRVKGVEDVRCVFWFDC